MSKFTRFCESEETKNIENICDNENTTSSLPEPKPSIVLEVISNRQTYWVISLTWIGFTLSLIMQILEKRIYYQAQNLNLLDTASLQSTAGVESSFHRINNASTLTGMFTARVDRYLVGQLHGIVTLNMVMKPALDWNYDDTAEVSDVFYDVNLLACFQSEGCKLTQYQTVLALSDKPVTQTDSNTPNICIFRTFQNQESFLSAGTIFGYFIQVRFHGDRSSSEVLFDITSKWELEFNVTPKRVVRAIKNGGIAALSLLISFGVWWLWALKKKHQNLNKRLPEGKVLGLPERKWLVLFWVGLILMTNPFFLFSFETPTPTNAFASLCIENMGASIVLYVILLFSDGASPLLAQGLKRKMAFYSIKAIPVSIRFVSLLVIRMIEFPSVTGTNISPALSTENWSHDLIVIYWTCGLLYSASLLLGVGMIIYFLYNTRCHLLQENYMKTRRQQLAFGFFFFQFSLYAVLLLVKWITLIKNFLKSDDGFLNDSFSSMFSAQSVYGRLVYLVPLLFTEMYMYLPAEEASLFRPGKALKLLLLENESRPESISQKHFFRSQHTLIRADSILEPEHVPLDFFVAETGVKMFELAWEVYQEPSFVRSKSVGTQWPFDINRLGFRFLRWIYKSEDETNCMIVRNIQTNDIVVAFRGTSSKTHVGTDANFFPVFFNTTTMCFEKEVVPKSVSDDEDLKSFGFDVNRCNNAGLERSSIDSGVGERKLEPAQAVSNLLDIGDAAVELGIQAGAKLFSTAKIHRGFWASYKLVREELHAIIRECFLENPAPKIITVGHSLGGALASCAAMDLAIHTLPKLNVVLEQRNQLGEEKIPTVCVESYTYGSPRVGNFLFASAYNKIVPRTFRIQNEGDLIPLVPPPWMGFCHVGYSIVVNSLIPGKVLLDPSPIEDLFGRDNSWRFDPHMLPNYETALLGLLEGKLSSTEQFTNINNLYKRMRPDNFSYSTSIIVENKGTMTEETVFSGADSSGPGAT